MAKITTTTEIIQDESTGFECKIYLTRRDHMPDEVEIQISVDESPISWGAVHHNFVEVLNNNKFRREWNILREFLKPEYFQQIETTINQWRNQKI